MLPQLLLNGLIAGSIYALVALGFSVVYKTVRFFHFAHGVIYAAGAYAAYSIVIGLGLPPIVGFLFAAVVSALLGIIVDRVVYRPLRARKATSFSMGRRSSRSAPGRSR
jgi:branched-chain amino acid transport system permease protein